MRALVWVLAACAPCWGACSSTPKCGDSQHSCALEGGEGGANGAGASSAGEGGVAAAGESASGGQGGTNASAGMAGSESEATGGAGEGGAAAGEPAGGAGGAGDGCEIVPVAVGALESDALSEVSGIVASARNPGVYYVHNDSGDTARFFAINEQGRTLAELVLKGATAVDWEDIALGPGPGGGSFVYLGDVGDNGARVGTTPRESIAVYRVAEPLILSDEAPAVVQVDDWARLPLQYPGNPHDCEALILDPKNADLLLVTKENDGKSSVFRASGAAAADATQTLELVTQLAFSTTQAPGSSLVTGGELSPRGDGILIRTYTSIFYWPRAAGSSLASALLPPPQQLPAPDEEQGEAITFSADGQSYLTVSENEHAAIFRAEFCDL